MELTGATLVACGGFGVLLDYPDHRARAFRREVGEGLLGVSMCVSGEVLYRLVGDERGRLEYSAYAGAEDGMSWSPDELGNPEGW